MFTNKAKENVAEEFSEADPLNEEENNETVKVKRNFKQACCHAMKNMTVEPTMFLYVLGCILSMLTAQNLALEKACRVDLNFTDEICDSLIAQSLEGQNKYERAVQKLLARAMAWRTYLTATIPCIIALLVGSWSDKTGYRKIFLLYSLTGQTLACINAIFHTYFLDRLSLDLFVFTDAIIEAFTGYWCVCFLTLFAYISAITTEQNRTFRLGLINFSLTVGFPVGMVLSGPIIRNLGYYGGFGIAGFTHILNFLYNLILSKDPEKNVHQMENAKQGTCYLLRSFFNLANIKESISVLFEKRANQGRTRIIVMLFVATILFGPMHGEMTILYISARYRFSWDEVQFSVFQTYNFVTHTIGTIFAITYFSKYLQWHDSVIGIISTSSKILASFFYGFATNDKIFYIAPLVDFLNGTALIAVRSIVSKLVDANELGKVNSIFALTENLTPLLYVPLYTKVYTASMEALPGVPFLMGSAMTVPALVVYVYLFYEHRKKCTRIKSNTRTNY